MQGSDCSIPAVGPLNRPLRLVSSMGAAMVAMGALAAVSAPPPPSTPLHMCFGTYLLGDGAELFAGMSEGVNARVDR